MKPLYLSLFLVGFVGCANNDGNAPTPSDPDASAERQQCSVHVPDQFPTLQEAMASSHDGDVICLGAGTFEGPYDLVDRQVRILGSGPQNTVLRGTGEGSVLDIYNSHVQLAGLTITGGSAEEGGGIEAVDSHLQLAGVDITGNQATGDGGGLNAQNSEVELHDVNVTDNYSEGKGGGISVIEGSVVGRKLIVTDNVSTYHGGGADFGRAGVHIWDSAFVGNEVQGAHAEGGGLDLHNTDGVIQNTLIANNTSDHLGGGVTIAAGNGQRFANVDILANSAGQGGAMHVEGLGETVRVVNTIIAHNHAEGDVGGVLVTDGGDVQFAWTDFWANDGRDVAGMDHEMTDAEHVYRVDPMFAWTADPDPFMWNLRLMPESPLVDAGNPEIVDPDGSRSDVGLIFE